MRVSNELVMHAIGTIPCWLASFFKRAGVHVNVSTDPLDRFDLLAEFNLHRYHLAFGTKVPKQDRDYVLRRFGLGVALGLMGEFRESHFFGGQGVDEKPSVKEKDSKKIFEFLSTGKTSEPWHLWEVEYEHLPGLVKSVDVVPSATPEIRELFGNWAVGCHGLSFYANQSAPDLLRCLELIREARGKYTCRVSSICTERP